MASADVVPLGDYFTDADTGDSATLMYKLVDSSDSSNPEKDTITYQQSSTDVLTATITAANPSATPPTVATLTLTGEAKTSADVSITVRATDTGGNSVDGTFAATVTNTLPTLVGSGIGGQTLAIGETTELTLTPYFSDTETSDANLSFSASSSDTAVVKTPTVNSTSKVMTMEVPGGATDKATATITVTATDESGKSLAQTFTATAASRPAFAASSPTTATLAENAVGSTTPVMVTDLTVSGSTDAKSYTLVSVDGQTSGADFGKFAVAAKTGATATTAEVTYKGALEDYETLKALLADCMPDVNEPLKCEPTFVLVIGVTDDTNGLMATTNTTLTVTVTDVNEAPTYVSASQDPSSPTLLEKLAGDNADATADTDDPRLLATLTFADVDASDTSLTYSVASVDPATLGTGNFSVAANSINPLKAELSFVGAASVISYGSGEGVVESFKVTVRASDDESPNPASVDQEVTVMVLENVAPTVSVAATGSPSLQPNSSLTLAATAADANTAAGDVLSYAWSVASASDGAAIGDITDLTATGASATLTVPAKPAGTTYGIQVTVTDLAEQTATADYSLVIVSAGAPILGAVSAMSFPAQFAIETQTLAAASGGIDTLTYSLTAVVASESTTAGMLANNLPQGLAFDATAANRALTGTPTVAAVGVYDMTYKVVDSVNESSMRTFKLTVTANQAPVFGQAAMDAVAASYNRVASRAIPNLVLPVATGGEGDLVYSLTATAGTASNISGGLPAGLAFDADTRTLSGTPTAVDSYSLTYAANDTDSNSAAGDTATIAFTLVVATDAVPALIPATAVTATGLKDRELTEINLPVAGGGNFGLTDSLSGKHTPVGGSATAVTVDATSGAISLSDGGASGLTFVAMTEGAATIKGAPTVAGVFDLDYKVVDGDLNTLDCTGVGTPSGCDTAMVSVTVTVTDPTLSLAGGNVANAAAVVLEQDLALSVAAITLPRATGDLSNTANISYALTSSQTVNSAGATINNPPVATVAGGAAALAGLTYTADDGSTAGSLAGTPTAAGTWTLTYTVTDDNGTTTGAGNTADDKEASISFTVQVVADSTLTLAALSSSSFNYLDGDTVGADSSTAFALPGITGGNTPIVESLTTTCALSGGSCAADALTTGSNPAPKGLTFAASSGATPAGLTGTFSSPGTYSLTYSVTDTAIGNTATYQTANVADDEEVAFTLVVQANSVPTLLPATAVTSTGLKGRRLTEINLPLTGGGNFGLTDSLSGTHTPVSGSATAVTVDATSGAISLSGGGATGLTFTAMTEGAASISGTPSVTGAFALVYKVVDGDSNTLDCTGANSPSGCDTAMVSVTLTVMDPTLALTGGVADGAAVELEQGVALSVAPIVLPLVTSGESASANLSYSLQSSRTVDSAGAAIGSPTAATVAGGSVALPGLTYTAIAGSTAGRLSGTPSEAGTWTLTYAVTDDNGTTTGASATDDDVVEGISFTVAVVTDSVPNLADARETALSGKTFDYVTGGAVGADASTAFALPGITGGNGAIAESLATTCDALSDGICDGDAVTSASNPAPKGLTFAASSGATPAGLTGIFGSTGIYTVTYSLTDTAIANGAYQPADTADAVEVEFTLQVEANAAPSLASTSAINEPGLATREVLITLPVASGGDGDLTDSLAGTHMPVSGSATAVAVDATSGAISLSGGGASGLTFNARTGDGSSKAATITGAPVVTGTFALTYKVVDGDSNAMGGDEATVSVTLVVTDPMLTLAGGNVADGAAVVLKHGAALSVAPITLPRVTSGATASANISYAMTTVPSGGVTGLTYTADDGTTAGSLAGTPAAGSWTLTYTATDNNGTPSNTGDDATASISFTVAVVADDVPDLADTALSGGPFLTGDAVGVDSATAFALPSFTGGNGTITQSLATACTLSGSSCAGDAVTTGSNPAPKGLTFAVSSGSNPAGLTGTFGSAGTYSLTYSVTDTAIANSATYQTADVADVDSVTFTLLVEADVPPSLSSASPTGTGLTGRMLEIALPVASAGNKGLTDSLSGTHDPDGSSATAVTVDATSGAISLSGGGATGLTFNARTSGTAATITGAPSVTGTFALIYSVVDGDSNTVGCTGANTPSGCDTAMATLALTVTTPALALTGGNVADGATVVLTQGTALSTDIALPRLASDTAGTSSYVLTSIWTVDSGGAPIPSLPTETVADRADALPGLSLTADNGTTAGRLSGTPSEAGIWALTYAITAGDETEEINFRVQVVGDLTPSLDANRKGQLSGQTTGHGQGEAVGSFALPGSTGGNGARTESLVTTCAVPGSACVGNALTTVSGNSVPAGLTFTASNGATPASLSGSFDGLGVYTVTYSVTDTAIENTRAYQPADDTNSDSVTFSFSVLRARGVAAVAFGAATIDDQSYVVGNAITGLLLPEAVGGTAPLAYLLTGQPPGLVFNPGRRELTGIPTQSGTFRLTYGVFDGNSEETKTPLTFTIVVVGDVQPALANVADRIHLAGETIAAITLPVGTGGNGSLTYDLSGTFAPRGGIATAIAVDDEGDIVQGSVDSGLDYTAASGDTAASIDGSPTTLGVYALTYTVFDEDGDKGLASFTLRVIRGVCPGEGGRTEEISEAIIAAAGASSCDEVTVADLARIRSFKAGGAGKKIGSLQRHDFEGMDGVTTLDLSDNDLSDLPSNTSGNAGGGTGFAAQSALGLRPQVVFEPLSALSSLDLSGNQFEALKESYFSGLGNLEMLDLSNNELTQAGVPAGVFQDLSSLTNLDLTGNAEAIVFEVSLKKGNSAGEVVLRLEQGAPETFTVPVLVDGASAQTANFAAGAVQVVVSISFDAGTETASVSLGDPDASTDKGYSVVAADTTLALENPEFRRDLSRHKEILARHGLGMAVGAARSISARAAQMLSSAGPQAALDVQGRSHLSMPLRSNASDDGSGGNGGGGLAFWMRIDQDSQSGDDDSLKWDGDVGNTHIGFDYAVNSNLALGLIHTTSDGSYTYGDTHSEAVFARGEYDNSMAVIHPWLAYKLDSGLRFHGSFGTGSGTIDVMGEDNDLGSADATFSSVILSMHTPLTRGTFKLDFKGEYISGGIDMDASERLESLSGSASTIKLAVENSANYVSDSGTTLSSNVSLGFRSDSGDVGGSSGLEIGAGVDYSTAGGFTIGGNFRTLLGGDYEETGFSLALSYKSDRADRGLSFSLTPSWGDLGSKREQLWSGGFASLVKPGQTVVQPLQGSLKSELSYSWASGLGVWTPYSTVQWSEEGTGKLQLGTRLRVSETFGLELASDLGGAGAGAGAGADSAGDLLLRGTLRF